MGDRLKEPQARTAQWTQWKENEGSMGGVAARSGIEAKRAVAGENQREIVLALPSMTIRFLHMGFVSRRIPDIWQAI